MNKLEYTLAQRCECGYENIVWCANLIQAKEQIKRISFCKKCFRKDYALVMLCGRLNAKDVKSEVSRRFAEKLKEVEK